MDKQTARRLIDELIKCQRMLDEAEVVARDVKDGPEQLRIRKAIMRASGVLYTEVILGTISEYPDLNPYPSGRDTQKGKE